MGLIRVLEPQVANQIAAGEVVERPASVVKELLENSLDAGASRIGIEIRGGGADLIRVTDDGCGMERDDTLLAVERHATSKIRSADDLLEIASFGFRGEALPSIASVSRLVVTTSPGGSVAGTRLEIAGGEVTRSAPAAHPRGTTVEVEALFYNAPARRKFLRSAASETTRIADLVAALAAAQPAIGFRLTSEGRELASWGPVPSARDRVAQILGAGASAALLSVEGRLGEIRLGGLASSPSLHRSTAREVRLYVNARPVRDRRIAHAIQAAYATLLPRGRYPVVYLFLSVPPDQVDVNVHPAKTEVRFLRPGAIHDLVRESLLRTLQESRVFPRLAEAPHAVTETSPGGYGSPWPSSSGRVPRQTAVPAAVVRRGDDDIGLHEDRGALLDTITIAPLAQFRESYILASSPDGLLIFDQHAAHERVLYDRLIGQTRRGEVERQRLLFPLTPEVTAAQSLAFGEAAEAFQALGFGVVKFGEGVLRIDEVPALVPIAGVDRLVRELLDETLEWDKSEGVERLTHRLVASSACHAAVTANHPLGAEEMQRIVHDLMRTESPMTCPHGRPVLLRLTLAQLEKEFRRR